MPTQITFPSFPPAPQRTAVRGAKKAAKAPAAAAGTQPYATREEWLVAGMKALAEWFRSQGVPVPTDYRVACSFPGGGSPRKRIGECWARSRSQAGINEVFVSPTIADPVDALNIGGHELLHAADDCKSGHKGDFNKFSRMVSYTGGKQSQAAGEALVRIRALAVDLGPYPHKALVLVAKQAKEGNGLHGCECGCGNKVYSTAKKLEEYGFPVCPACGEEMLPVERGTKSVKVTV